MSEDRAAPDSSLARVDRLLEAGVLLLAFMLGLTWILDTDIGWRIAAGRWIVENGRVPHADPYSFFEPGRPWILLSWLFDLGAWFLDRLGGAYALTLAKAFIAALLVPALARAAGRDGGGFRPLILLVVVAAGWSRFHPRPEFVTALLLALLLGSIRRGPVSWWWVPGFALWANIHSLFAVGLASWGAAWLGRCLDRGRGRAAPGPAALKGEAARIACAALATIANPYLFAGSLFPLVVGGRLLDPSIGGVAIAELGSPLAAPLIPFATKVFFALAAAALAAVIALRAPGPSSLVALALVPLGLLSHRGILLGAIGALPILAEAARDARKRCAAKPAPRAAGRALVFFTLVMLLADVVSGAWFVRNFDPRRVGTRFVPYFYPVRTAARLAASGREETIWNDLNIGGYLLARVPGARVVRDTRLEVHGEEVFRRISAIEADSEAWRVAARQFGVTVVVMQRGAVPRGVAEATATDSGWVEIEDDPSYRAWVRAPEP